MNERVIRFIAGIPAPIHAKLLAAFLASAGLLLMLGAVSLQVLAEAGARDEAIASAQRKIAAYRQLQNSTRSQLYQLASALSSPNQMTLDTTRRQLEQASYDVDRLRFVAKDDAELLSRIERESERFIAVAATAIELVRAGKVAEAQELQRLQASPIADRLERLSSELVNKAEAGMVATADRSRAAYDASRWIVIAFGLASIALATLLGYAISASLSAPVRQMEARLREIGAGDFSRHVDLTNRDELGALATDLNSMNDELGRLYRELETANRERARLLEQLQAVNASLEERVADQVGQLGRMSRLTRFLSPQVAEMVARDDAGLTTRRRELTVLFADVRGFTTFSETLEPEELIAMLNEHLGAMTEVVFAEGGTLDKYLGDGIMSFFGDPISQEDHAVRAVRCAIAMQHRLAELQRAWFADGRPKLAMGVGVNSGWVTVGLVGSASRSEYTVIGDNVNLASRLASAAGPGEVLLSDKTRRLLGGALPVETRGELSVKGKVQPVQVYAAALEPSS